LVEICVTVLIVVILTGIAAPIYVKSLEQGHLDMAAGTLKSICSAQRVYWLSNESFCNDLTTLKTLDLVDVSIPTVASGNEKYVYTIQLADDETFEVTATRANSTSWTGTITIDETGELTGTVSSASQGTLTPTSH